MNKTQLVEKIAEKANITKKKADEALRAFESVVTETLSNNEAITLVGFGTFEVKDRKSRMGRNPRTKDVVQIEARRVPKFRAGKALKDAIK